MLLLPEMRLADLCKGLGLSFPIFIESNKGKVLGDCMIDDAGCIWVHSQEFLNWWLVIKMPERQLSDGEVELLSKVFGQRATWHDKTVDFLPNGLTQALIDGFIVNIFHFYVINWMWLSGIDKQKVNMAWCYHA